MKKNRLPTRRTKSSKIHFLPVNIQNTVESIVEEEIWFPYIRLFDCNFNVFQVFGKGIFDVVVHHHGTHLVPWSN